jgi:hypothetical protein
MLTADSIDLRNSAGNFGSFYTWKARGPAMWVGITAAPMTAIDYTIW